MKEKLIMILIALTAGVVLAEELGNISSAERSRKIHVNDPILPRQVNYANVAGVGLFLNEPSSDSPTVDIQMQQWWTPPLATNVVRIYELNPYSTNWIFPTNVPVVFFAVTKRQMYPRLPELLAFDVYPPEWVFSITNATEMAKLMFSNTDRAWFRTTRDNGLVYELATNLWSCVRTNPNPTNYYAVLRDAERTVSKQDSWRVHFDAYHGLSFLFDDASESYLAEKLDDPLLSPVMKGSVRAILYDKFGWRYVNGVITPPQ